MKRNEFLFVVIVISLSAGLISNIIKLPTKFDSVLLSPITKTILVILTLYGFSISPAIGLSLTLLTAVLIFQHNISFVNNLQTSNPLYNNSLTSFVRNLFTPSTIDSPERLRSNLSGSSSYWLKSQELDSNLSYQESAEYADMIEPHPAEGSYPSDESRPTNYESSLEYNYRPQDDIGSDDFIRFGPNIDEKLDVLHE